MVERQQEVETEPSPGTAGLVDVEVRRLPLVGHREIEVAVPVEVGGGDASGDRRPAESDLGGHVVVPPISSPHEERVVGVPAQVVAGLETRPGAGIGQELVVAHGEFLQLGPAVDLPCHEPGCLDRLGTPVVVEVAEPGFP